MSVVGTVSSPGWLRGFADGLGRRAVRWRDEGVAVEVLRLSPRLSATPACASALAEAAAAFAGLDHPALNAAPKVEHLADGAPALVSRYLPGERLVELLTRTDAAGAPLPTSTVLFILRELIGAVHALHASGPGHSHGAISPERVLVTPDLRVVLLDHALGRLLARVAGESPADLWAECSIAVPTAAELPPFSPLTDQLQLGLTGLAMLLGRPLRVDEYPGRVEALLDSAQETDLVGGRTPLGPMLREWLARMSLVSRNGPFPELEAAAGDLDILLSDDSGYVAAPLDIEVVPARLEPLSEPEVASLGLVFPAADRDQPVHFPPALTLATQEPIRPDDEVAWEPEGPPAEPAVPGGTPDGRQPVPQLTPAPDPTANSERILELAHGLDASRARRALSQGDQAASPGGAQARSTRKGLMVRVWRGEWSARAAVAAAGVVITLTAGVAAGAYYVAVGGARSAHLLLESSPPGASVVLEGQTLGRTPVEVSLPRGGHVLEIQGQHSSQSLSVVLGAGERRTEHVTLPEAGSPGTLVITTEPVGIAVSVDGVARGTAPLSLPVPPGRHVVAAANEVGRASREVEVQSDAWVKVPLAVSGWVEVMSPVPVRTKVFGSPVPDGATRFALAPGRHRLQFVNEDIGLRDSQDVVVEAGRTTQVTVTGTAGVLEITSNAANATVWIDGTPAGRAPLTVTLALGRHDIRFAHAEYGELRYDVFVKMGSSFLHGDFGRTGRPAQARTPARRR